MQRPGASSKFVNQDYSWTAVNVLAVVFPDKRRAEWKYLIIDARDWFWHFFDIVEGAWEGSPKTSEDVWTTR